MKMNDKKIEQVPIPLPKAAIPIIIVFQMLKKFFFCPNGQLT